MVAHRLHNLLQADFLFHVKVEDGSLVGVPQSIFNSSFGHVRFSADADSLD